MKFLHPSPRSHNQSVAADFIISQETHCLLCNILLTAISSLYDKDFDPALCETLNLMKMVHHVTESGYDSVFK
jgi:hypothetical protein